jgi:DNA-binding transcriptional MocR family regulator
MPRAIREELIHLARKYDALIICDDVYDFVYWEAEPKSKGSGSQQPFTAILPRLVDLDRTIKPTPLPHSFGNVLSNGSFSKIVAPGVRTGWVQSATPKLAQSISQAGVTRSGGAASNLTGTMLAHALRTKALENHICGNLHESYARRWRRLVSAVEEYLGPLGVIIAGGKGNAIDPQSLAFSSSQSRETASGPVAGGFFIWLKLPTGLTDAAVSARALRDANVALATETQCRLPVSDSRLTQAGRYIRLCFAFEPEEKLGEGVLRLKGVLENMLREVKDGGGGGGVEVGLNVHEYA